MNLLTLTTAEKGAGIALFQNQVLTAHSYWASPMTHSQRLLAMIQDMITQKADLQLEDIDAFVAAKGPGSFTGLRIGISVIKGLAFALSKPQAGVSSIDGIAWQFAFSDLPVVIMMDARRSEVYTAIYRFSKGRLIEKIPETVTDPETAAVSALEYARETDFLMAGAGVRAYEKKIRQICGNQACFCPSCMDAVSAPCLALPVFQDPDFFHSPENILTPSYLRSGY